MTSALTLRVGDAERDSAASRLAEHFAAGRLDETEYQDRLSSAFAARTEGDLVGLFADLPPLLQQRPARVRRVPALLLALPALGLALLFAVAAAGRGRSSSAVLPYPAGPYPAGQHPGWAPPHHDLVQHAVSMVGFSLLGVVAVAACVAALWVMRRHAGLHR